MAALQCPPQAMVASEGQLQSQGQGCAPHNPGTRGVLKAQPRPRRVDLVPTPSTRPESGHFPPRSATRQDQARAGSSRPSVPSARCSRPCPSPSQTLHGLPVLTRAPGPQKGTLLGNRVFAGVTKAGTELTGSRQAPLRRRRTLGRSRTPGSPRDEAGRIPHTGMAHGRPPESQPELFQGPPNPPEAPTSQTPLPRAFPGESGRGLAQNHRVLAPLSAATAPQVRCRGGQSRSLSPPLLRLSPVQSSLSDLHGRRPAARPAVSQRALGTLFIFSTLLYLFIPFFLKKGLLWKILHSLSQEPTGHMSMLNALISPATTEPASLCFTRSFPDHGSPCHPAMQAQLLAAAQGLRSVLQPPRCPGLRLHSLRAGAAGHPPGTSFLGVSKLGSAGSTFMLGLPSMRGAGDPDTGVSRKATPH